MGAGAMVRASLIRPYYPSQILNLILGDPLKHLVSKRMRPKATKRSVAAQASEWLETGAKAAAAIKTGVQLAEVVLPYLTPLIL